MALTIPYNAEVKERVVLYLYCAFLAGYKVSCTLHLPLLYLVCLQGVMLNYMHRKCALSLTVAQQNRENKGDTYT